MVGHFRLFLLLFSSSSFNDTIAHVHDNGATILSTYILIIVVFMQQMMTADRKARGARNLHRRRPDGLGEYGVWYGLLSGKGVRPLALIHDPARLSQPRASVPPQT